MKVKGKAHESTQDIDVEKIERETEELLERYRKQNNQSEMITSKRDLSALDGNISKINS